MDFTDAYMRLGALGFLVMTVGILAWRMSEIAKLMVLRRLNGKIAMAPQPVPIPAPDCPWNPKLTKNWDKMVEQVRETHAGMEQWKKEVYPGVMKGDYGCLWTSQEITELITEIRLLRRELELTRNGRK